jgi:hypothetical protein
MYTHSPVVSLHDPLDFLLVHDKLGLLFKHHRDSCVAIAGIALDQRVDRPLNHLIYEWSALASGLVVHTGPGHPKLNLFPSSSIIFFTPKTSSRPLRASLWFF